MIRKLLRKDFINSQVLKGGHGWSRPDVPLDLNYQYKHKREISIYDTNMWFYDQSQPEFMINNGEQYLHTPFNAAKVIAINAFYIGTVALGLGLFMFAFQNQGVETQNVQSLHESSIDVLTRIQKDRIGSRRNFLDLDLTGENGWIHTRYDHPYYYTEAQARKDECSVIYRLNQDGKNFVTKVEQEVIEKLQKKNAGAKSH